MPDQVFGILDSTMQQTPANNGYNADLLDVVPFGATQLVDVGFGSEVLACANTVINPDAVLSCIDMTDLLCNRTLLLNIK